MSFREKLCLSERKRTFGRKSVRNPGEKIMHTAERKSMSLSQRKFVKYIREKSFTSAFIKPAIIIFLIIFKILKLIRV